MARAATAERHIQINVRASQDTVNYLNFISDKTGINKSELIDLMIRKIRFDTKMQKIIMMWSKQDHYRIKKGATSHNAHYDDDEKTGSHHSKPGTVSLNVQEDYNEWKENMPRLIKIAKAKWIDED